MKIAVYGRPTDNNVKEFFDNFFLSVKRHKIDVIIYEPFYKYLKEEYSIDYEFPFFNSKDDINANIDFLFSFGGDGTLLNTITFVRKFNLPIVGINTGRLGFLASIAREEFDMALQFIQNNNFSLDERTLLKVESNNDVFGEYDYALNELTVHKFDSTSMIHIYTYANNEYLNSYWSDGLIVSTPTGSTAYSLSCGGPIICPDSHDFIITPIATHNLFVRPIILPDSYTIKLIVRSSTNNILVGLDSRSHVVDTNSELLISKHDFTVKLIRIPEKSFFSTIREKLLWGLDIRN